MPALLHHDNGTEPPSGPVRKPIADQSLYRFLTLPNGLRILLVHDALADKAAAACDVSTNAYLSKQ